MTALRAVVCRPTECPKLTNFCTALTAITQDMVDSGVVLKRAVERFHEWLRGHGLVDTATPWQADPTMVTAQGAGTGDGKHNSTRLGFAVVTWGDCDVMTTLRGQLQRLNLPLPPYFTYWINLKALFR